KAIIPVHMINLACNMDAVMQLAAKYNLLVLEDACQAIGCSYHGRHLGTIGHAGAYSFNKYKNITCGEGGALVTNDKRTYVRALMYHDAGAFTRTYATAIKEPFFPGVNYRVSEIQGAIMGEQLKRLDRIIARLKAQREIMVEVFSRTHKFEVVKPHNDEKEAVGLTLNFESAAAAAALKTAHPEVNLLIQSGRHVYTNWDPLLEQHSFHPKMNPFKWANRKIIYTKDMCARTLAVLARSIQITVPYELDENGIRKFAEKLIS
ncbi:MAG: DegT/DnrJ/EryC1/StrS family aminotransferase, partial [Victivallales bacterium]|nr:DegT/DnrJ/EryC1/StrS family aminotransferase [Victivallales bacterium]